MKFLDKLEKRLGHLAVSNVVLTLIIAQLVVYAMILIGQVDFRTLPLVPGLVLAKGEFWRLFSFIIAPPFMPTSAFNALFLALFWYVFWMMSSALESVWGVFRFNVFLLLGILFTITGAFLGHFISPAAGIVVYPDFLYLSVFFAFATIYPNFEFLLFFVLPVKVKWLAWLGGAMVAFSVIFAASWGERLAILGPIFNYMLFFRADLVHRIQSGQRRSQFQARKREQVAEAFHTCSVCGATDKSHPERHFRYKTVEGKAVCLCDVCREAQREQSS